MKRILLTALTLGLLAAGTAVVLAAGDDAPAPTTPATDAREDVSGPCDEAEHANDPRCAPGGAEDRDDDGRGRAHPEDDGVVDDDRDDDGDEVGEDISGPCDEAEHADDPRCTGEIPADDDADEDRVDNRGPGSLNSGPGSVSSGHDEDEDEVDNSGPGSVNSGHDDGDDDNSGSGSSESGSSGSGGGDDDSSGSGSGGDDD